MQARRSSGDGSRGGHSRGVSWGSSQGRNSMSREGLIDDLAEDSSEEGQDKGKKPLDEELGLGGRANGAARLSGSGRVRSVVERESVRPSKGLGRGE